MSEHSSTASKWREIIDRQRASGLSVGAFCRRDAIAESSFFAWRRRLGSTPPVPAFVEAKLTPAPRPGVIEVQLRGGRRVRVRPGFDAALLAQVVVALEAAP